MGGHSRRRLLPGELLRGAPGRALSPAWGRQVLGFSRALSRPPGSRRGQWLRQCPAFGICLLPASGKGSLGLIRALGGPCLLGRSLNLGERPGQPGTGGSIALEPVIRLAVTRPGA